MTLTISIDQLRTRGACKPECDGLAILFPAGEVLFDQMYFQTLVQSGINLMWGAAILAPGHRTELALSWFDRAIALGSPDWKDPIRALVATPEGTQASAQLVLRLADRRAATPEDAVAVGLAGLGYAASAYAVKMADQPNPTQVHASMALLATWSAQCAAIHESLPKATVVEQLQQDVWSKLIQYGAA
jgi:hypothetical protein